MATSTNAFFLLRGIGSRVAGTGLVPVADGSMAPEGEPAILWGQGTPAGTLAPWTLVNKGSLYAEVNDTDDQSHVWMKVDEGGDAEDWMPLLIGGGSSTTGANTIAQTYASAELHGVDIVYTGTQASGGNLVALNVKHTTAGTTGSWAAGLFVNITQGTTKNVSGYLTAAEFELTSTLASGASDMFVITLNSWKTNAGNGSAFVAIRDYGTSDMEQLFSFYDETATTIASTSATLISTQADLSATHLIRCVYGSSGTPIWLMATVNGN